MITHKELEKRCNESPKCHCPGEGEMFTTIANTPEWLRRAFRKDKSGCIMDKEKILDEFIKIEKNKCLAGSGDDGFYVNQVEKYINSQRPLWLEAIEYFMNLQKNKKR